jgi:hypothetical protein
MALWIAIALDFLFDRFSKPSIASSALKLLISAGFLFALYQTNIKDNDRHQDSWAVEYAKTVLHSLPKNAILFTHGDLDAGPLEYLHDIEGVRKDITLVNDQGLGFSEKLFSPLQKPKRSKRIREFIEKHDRFLFYTNENLPHPYRRARFGFLFRIIKDPGLTPRTIAAPSHLEFLKNTTRLRYRDPWIESHIELLMAYACSTLTRLSYETPRPDARHAALLETFSQTFLTKLYRVRDLIYLDPRNSELIEPALAELNRLEPQEPSKQVRAWFHVIQGKHRANQNRQDQAIADYLAAIEIYPHHTNEALRLLLAHYAAVGDIERFLDLKNRFFEERRPFPEVKKLEKLLRAKTSAKPDNLD